MDKKFDEHLKRASRIVKKWPDWKKNCLGGIKVPEIQNVADKHKRLFDLLPEGARPKNIVRYADWYSETIGQYDYQITTLHAHERIEHAARLYYEGEGYQFNRRPNGEYAAGCIGWSVPPMPLIDALLAAAEHAREGEGEK